MYFFFFFFNDTATTEIYTLSLHDALPISVNLPQQILRAHVSQAEITHRTATRCIVRAALSYKPAQMQVERFPLKHRLLYKAAVVSS